MGYNLHFNAFSEEEINILFQESQKIFNNKTSKFITNHTAWDSRIVNDSNTVLVYNIAPNEKSFHILSNFFLNKFQKIPKNFMFYYWMQGSYIPWHDDGYSSKAFTLYLNKSWDLNWGGLYNCINNERIETIFPKYNLLVEQFGNMLHSTTPTTNLSPVRQTIQTFV